MPKPTAPFSLADLEKRRVTLPDKRRVVRYVPPGSRRSDWWTPTEARDFIEWANFTGDFTTIVRVSHIAALLRLART